MIQLENVNVIFQHKDKEIIAVKEVSLQVKEGEIYGIVGTSGAGKSSLIRTINGLQKPTSGKVIVDGQNIVEMKGSTLRNARKKIGMIFQHFNLISRKTVGENIEFALKIQNYPKEKRAERVLELLDIVGLSDKKDAYPANLSGGQKQRVGIARALSTHPKILLCDEATSALDSETTQEIVGILKRINQDLGITIVFITHQLELAKILFDRIAVMSLGEIVEESDAHTLFASPGHEVTQRLVRETIKIPDQIVRQTKGEILTLIYKGVKSMEPVMAYTHKQFDVVLNILQGKIEYIQNKPIGVLVVAIEGNKLECEKAKDYIRQNVAELIVFEQKKGDLYVK